MLDNSKFIIFKQLNVIDGRWGRPVCTLGIGGDQFIQTVKAQSHYDAGGAPVRDSGIYRDEQGLYRDEPGLQRESIKTLNTSGMNQESPARTGKDRRGNGNKRDGIVTQPTPMQTSS
ncbi:hypothetical protein DPMN_042057 [Dreissena polymorpha]|uniref:Uncharacterized protein n=1 Tax=Dreissena polymorpha TaxID=45954 RepID=A0A9D4CY07_DREPO|nr:hypothetical protein DPMN_042057 [Dreissena polymorpha]